MQKSYRSMDDAQVIKGDRESPLIVMRYDDFIDMFKQKLKKL